MTGFDFFLGFLAGALLGLSVAFPLAVRRQRATTRSRALLDAAEFLDSVAKSRERTILFSGRRALHDTVAALLDWAKEPGRRPEIPPSPSDPVFVETHEPVDWMAP